MEIGKNAIVVDCRFLLTVPNAAIKPFLTIAANTATVLCWWPVPTQNAD